MPERTLDIGTRNFTEVIVTDEPGEGNACHRYQVVSVGGDPDTTPAVFAEISFQNGPIEEVGVNGCQQEDMLAVVIDRLQGFQGGSYQCHENASAITKLKEALVWLRHRTDDRIRRWGEGRNLP